MYQVMHQLKDTEKTPKTMSVTQTLNVLNISTSTTYDVLEMGTNDIIAMNEGFNPNQVRNYAIEY